MYKSFLKCIKMNTVDLVYYNNVQSCNRTTAFLILGLLRDEFFVPALDASPVLGWRCVQEAGKGR